MTAVNESGPVAALSETEQALVEAVLAGQTADLKRKSVRAAVLRDLVLEARDGWRLPPAGIRIERAVIQGTLDLEGATVTQPIIIRHSRIEGGGSPRCAVNVRDARLKRLGLHSSTIQGSIIADRVEVERGVFIGGGVVEGVLQIRGAAIGGALAVEGTEIGDGTSAILAAGCAVTGPLIIRRARMAGELAIPRVRIGAGIYGEEVTVTAATIAINAEGARLEGDLILDGARLAGAVRLSNARIEGRLAAEGLEITAAGDALLAGGLGVSQGINLANARLTGSVWLDGALVGKRLRADGIHIDGGETAISADVIEIGGSWEMQRARLVGQVRLTGAKIAGQLRMTEAKIFGSDLAVRADGSSMAGGCFMARTVIVGLVRLAAADLGNQLRLTGATLKVDQGAALFATGTRFRRDVELDRGFQTVGAVVLDQATIDGALDLRGSHVKSARIARGGPPLPPTPTTPAGASPATTTASAATTPRMDELALSLVDAAVGRLQQPERSDERSRGIVDLSRARVGSYEDAAPGWPPPAAARSRAGDGRDIDHLVLDGFVYEHLGNPAGQPAGTTTAGRASVAELRARWLEGQCTVDLDEQFKPQAWITLRNRLAAQGYDGDARALDIARRRRQRRARGQTRAARWQSRLLDWLALYGHNPWRTVGWSAVVIAAFALLWGWAYAQCADRSCFDERVMVVANRDAYTAEKFEDVYPPFDALAYSFDVFVPFLSFGYDDHWRPNPRYGPLVDAPLPHWGMLEPGKSSAPPPVFPVTVGGLLYVAMLLEVVLGLILTSLMVTSFSGLLLRQD